MEENKKEVTTIALGFPITHVTEQSNIVQGQEVKEEYSISSKNHSIVFERYGTKIVGVAVNDEIFIPMEQIRYIVLKKK